jgi:hypothetical protein
MERQSKESRGLEAHCRGGQGPPWAVAPWMMMYNIYKIFYLIAVCKPEAANTVRAPDDERYTARNMLSL